jgi:hypothetical protein
MPFRPVLKNFVRENVPVTRKVLQHCFGHIWDLDIVS